MKRGGVSEMERVIRKLTGEPFKPGDRVIIHFGQFEGKRGIIIAVKPVGLVYIRRFADQGFSYYFPFQLELV